MSKKTTDNEALRNEIREQLTIELRKEYQTQLDQSRVELETRLRDENQKTIETALADYKKQLAPPTEEDIQKALGAEYLQFHVTLKMRDLGPCEFELSELPASEERKFLRLLTQRVRPIAKQIGELTMNLAGGNVEDKILAFFEAVEPATIFLQDAVAMILSAQGDKKITGEQIGDSVSLVRQLNIIKAQIQCNRLRDFFSLASQIAVR